MILDDSLPIQMTHVCPKLTHTEDRSRAHCIVTGLTRYTCDQGICVSKYFSHYDLSLLNLTSSIGLWNYSNVLSDEAPPLLPALLVIIGEKRITCSSTYLRLKLQPLGSLCLPGIWYCLGPRQSSVTGTSSRGPMQGAKHASAPHIGSPHQPPSDN